MAAHSSLLAWRIPWTEEPGGLQSRGSQRVRQTERAGFPSYLRFHAASSESTCGIFLLNWELAPFSPSPLERAPACRLRSRGDGLW